jgi:hypothetical protein
VKARNKECCRVLRCFLDEHAAAANGEGSGEGRCGVMA